MIKKAALSIFGIAVLIAAGALLFFFRSEVLLEETSPDGSFKVVVSKRVLFPPSELIDPNIQVRVQLHRTSSPENQEQWLQFAEQRYFMFESSSAEAVSVSWDVAQQVVRIRGLKGADVEMPFPAETATANGGGLTSR